MAETRKIKPAMKRAQDRVAAQQVMVQQMLDEALSPGDTFEYGTTVAMKTRKGDVWLKVGVTSSVREGETGEDAKDRVTEFVHHVLATQAEEFQG